MSNINSNSQIKNEFNNEGFTDENDPNAPKKRRRRRPNPDNEEPRNNVDEVTNDTPKKRHRRKRRDLDSEQRESEPANHIGVAAYLEDLQDDIEMRAAEDEISTIDQLTISRGKTGVLQGTGDTVYVEGSRKFRAENQEKYMNDKLKESQKLSQRLNMDENRYENDLMQCAVTITNRFRILATYIHGIFGGLVLMYTVFSLISIAIITVQANQQGVFAIYSVLQRPFSIFNYLMFIFIGVSIMDRCDMGQPSTTCNQSQGGMIVALILILVAFILNNCLYYFNPFFNNYATNTSYATALTSVFQTWASVDAAKSILVCVSWFIVALLPVYDRFVDDLYSELRQDGAHDITSVMT